MTITVTRDHKQTGVKFCLSYSCMILILLKPFYICVDEGYSRIYKMSKALIVVRNDLHGLSLRDASIFLSVWFFMNLTDSWIVRTCSRKLHVEYYFLFIIWAAPCENISSGTCGQWWPRSACAFAQSDQGLHCPLTESLDITECMNWEQRPGWYFAQAQGHLNLRIFRSV